MIFILWKNDYNSLSVDKEYTVFACHSNAGPDETNWFTVLDYEVFTHN